MGPAPAAVNKNAAAGAGPIPSNINNTTSGISNSSDIIEFLLAGANFVQLGTINYKYPSLINALSDDIKNYLVRNNISHVKELIGGQIVDKN